MASLQKDLSCIKEQLTEAEDKLSRFSEKDKTEEQGNRKVCVPELPPGEAGESVASQTEGAVQVESHAQTPRIAVRSAGIQTEPRSHGSSEGVTAIIAQFPDRVEQVRELHAPRFWTWNLDTFLKRRLGRGGVVVLFSYCSPLSVVP